MHTAICAFDSHAQAEQAVDALVRAGFARHDVHIEHEHSGAEGRGANDQWDGLEREVAVDRSVVASFGHFFSSLFGRDNPSGHADTYAQHVERGGHVVVVDAHDRVEAQRAETLLRNMEAGHLSVVDRGEQQPLRDIVGARQAQGTAGMVERSRDSYESAGSDGVPATERDRAMASHYVNPTAGPSLRDPETEHAPGLRYADKDKPL